LWKTQRRGATGSIPVTDILFRNSPNPSFVICFVLFYHHNNNITETQSIITALFIGTNFDVLTWSGLPVQSLQQQGQARSIHHSLQGQTCWCGLVFRSGQACFSLVRNGEQRVHTTLVTG
jgi:hypothetical protein